MMTRSRITIFLVNNVLLVLLGMQTVFSQDNLNYLSVSNRLVNFNMNSKTALENRQVQTNAFDIKIKSNYNFSVYAIISNYYSSTGYVLDTDMLSVKLNSVVPSRSANFNDIPISAGNQLIIQGVRTGSQLVTYTYNLNVGPIGFDVPPGTFNATILFTMTRP